MTYKVGDEVWVRGTVTGIHGTPAPQLRFEGYAFNIAGPPMDDIRREAGFKDPLDEAIVARALEWFKADLSGVFEGTAANGLRTAVQAKVDIDKPKTVEGILEERWHYGEGYGKGSEIRRKAIERAVSALREAGLLREEDQ